MAADHAQQIPLNLGWRPAFGRDDFVVAPCNEEAVAALDLWPDWPNSILAIHGEHGAGKTHLAHVWCQVSKASVIAAGDIRKAVISELNTHQAIAVEDGEGLADEEGLLHLINAVQQDGGSLLLTGSRPPARWDIGLPDLASRLAMVMSVGLDLPDDALLKAIISKQFQDRQVEIPQDVLDYLAQRMSRSFAGIATLVTALDQASMAKKRPITKRLAADVLASLEP